MLTLYLLEDSRADRITWLLDVLKLKYRLEIFHRNPKTMLADPALKKIHPTGKSPLIKDGDQVIAESGVIVDYLIEKYGKDTVLAPRNSAEKWHIEYGLVACESNFMIAFMQLYIGANAKPRLPFGLGFIGSTIIDQINAHYSGPELVNNLTNLQDTIKANDGYFCGGHLSGADIMYLYNVLMVRRAKFIKDFDNKYPTLVEWCDRVKKEVDAARSDDNCVETFTHPFSQKL